MKRIVLIYLIILFGLFGILSMLDQKSDYIVEKKIWKIYKAQIDVAKDPNVVPERNFERIINEYRGIIAKYPNSRLIPGLHIRIGEIYVLRKDYEEARKIFFGLHEYYPDNKELLAEAMFQAGKTYETDDNWPEAYKVYKNIIDDFPLTDIGLSTPIYVANYYRNQNDLQGTMGAYEIAINHYKGLASAHENKSVGMRAMRHLANCYLDQNRWTEAIDTLGVILEKYSASNYLTVKNIDMIIKTINITAAYQLKDYDIAISLYQGIITRNPRHPLNDYLNRVIDAFDQLKEKGVQVSER